MPNQFTLANREAFVEKLLAWFAVAMRPLPWRQTYDPYSVWLSEIMLQQTQMERGVRYFNAWMRRFPDIRSVAEADEEVVLAAWEGLGYYSRARNLHNAAKRVMGKHQGVFPENIEDIRALPGVGEYTAGAIAAIAFNLPEPAVDANVLRIFARICDIDAPVAAPTVKAEITASVRRLLPFASSRLLCQALMELGALVCSKTPKCAQCPVVDYCAAHRNGTVPERPRLTGKTSYKLLELVAGVIVRDGRVLIRKRSPQGLWAGLWEFPGGEMWDGETAKQAVARCVAEETGLAASVRKKIATVKHGYTTWRVTLHGYLCEVKSATEAEPPGECLWVAPDEIGLYAFPAGHRKLLEKLGWKSDARER